MTWTRSNGAGAGAGSALAGPRRRAARWGAAGVAAAAVVAAGLSGASAASAAPAISFPVPCSVTALNAAINFAPSDSILVLKPGCVYVTNNPLHDITRNLTIVGSNDTIRFTGVGTILHILNGATVSISQLTFTGGDGVGTEPGAIHNVGGNLTLTSTTFRNNDGGYGGAIQNSNGATLLAISSTFFDNEASGILGGGAIANRNNSTTGTDGTSFVDNEGGNGGAIYNVSGTVFSPATASKSTFRDNSADGTTVLNGFGGAIYNADGQVHLTNADFTDNDANRDGGALRNVGGSSTLTNVGFTGNFSGTNGGAIYTSKSLTLSGNSLSGNRAAARGGAIYVNGATTTLSNNTLVFGNFAGISGGGIFRNTGAVSITTGSSVTLNFPNNCTGLIC
jgi:predicted outer membrane repeat protein